MTMLNATPSETTTPKEIRRRAHILLARVGRLVNGWIATAIARRERQSARHGLHHFSDREWKDIGLNRSDLGGT
jgi:uncharacterized protein YjiS (DUF1127 family)